jgi:ABC-type phosphate transport system substrate-binding protein
MTTLMDRLTSFFKPWPLPLVVSLCLALVSPGWAAASGNDVAVVLHPGVPVDDLSLAQVRRIFLGDQQFWSSDLRVTLLIRAPIARERDVILKIIYQMSEAQFRRYWIAKVFRAEVPLSPKIVYSNEMATELVGSIAGSIAFVDAAQVPEGLKILKIDGYLPGERGYPLR